MNDKPKWEMDSPYGDVKDKSPMKTTKKHSRRIIAIGSITIALILIFGVFITPLLNFSGLGRSQSKDRMDLVDRPSLETIYTASPFYTPELHHPSALGAKHKKNVQNKVEGILEITDEMMVSYLYMKQDIYDTVNIIFPLLNTIDQTYGTTYAQNSDVLKEMEELIASFELQEFRYYGLDIDKTDESLYDSDGSFARVVAAMTASEKVAQGYELLLHYSSNLFANYENDNNPEIQKQLNALQEHHEHSHIRDHAATLMAGVDTVNKMVSELDAANALLALDNLQYMGDNLQKVKKDVATLQNSNLVDEEFADLAVLMVEEYEAMYLALDQELSDHIDGLDLDLSNQEQSLSQLLKPRVIYASENKYRYGAGYDVQMLQKKGQEYMAEQKKAYDEKYKDESYWQTTVRTAKEYRKGVQDAVENMDAVTYETMRRLTAQITPTLGDKDQDVYSDIQKRYALAQKRIAENKGGEDVFKHAVQGFEATQNLVGEGWYNIGAFWEEELGLPEDSLAQVASTMGNLAAETFTQFGQGLSRILDPNAKDSDIAKGCMEVATSMVGGTNNVFSATKKSGAVLKKMGEIITSPKLHAQGVIDAIKGVKDLSLSKLGSLQYKESAVKGTIAVLKKSKEVATSMAKKLDDTFTKEISSIFTKNWKETLSGFRDYANRVGSNADEAAVKLIDEFVNGYIDNKVTELASHPWLWDPEVSDEEKEELIAKEVDKMNEDIQKGLETIEEKLEDSLLNGTYKGTWTLLDVKWLGKEEDLWERPGVGTGNLLNAFRENIGNSYPCTVEASGNVLTFKMAPQDTKKDSYGKKSAILYNYDNHSDPMVKSLEIIQNKGNIMGYKNEIDEDVSISSKMTKEKNTIEGRYYFTYILDDVASFKSPNFAKNTDALWGIIIGFHVEKNN